MHLSLPLSLRFSLPFSSHFWLTKRSAEISQNPHFTTLFIYDTFRISFRLQSAPPPDVIEWVYIFLICPIELVTGTKCSANIDTFCVFSKFVCTLPPNWVTEAEAVPETDRHRVEKEKPNNCRNYNNNNIADNKADNEAADKFVMETNVRLV